MVRYFRSLFDLFENVLHPASGWADSNTEKRKKKAARLTAGALTVSPECYNIRGASKKQDKLRRNPAP
jgi:hypothetical protein